MYRTVRQQWESKTASVVQISFRTISVHSTERTIQRTVEHLNCSGKMERKQNGMFEWNGTLTLYCIYCTYNIYIYIHIYILNSFHNFTPGTHCSYNSMQLYKQGMLYRNTVCNFGSNCYVAAWNERHWRWWWRILLNPGMTKFLVRTYFDKPASEKSSCILSVADLYLQIRRAATRQNCCHTTRTATLPSTAR